MVLSCCVTDLGRTEVRGVPIAEASSRMRRPRNRCRGAVFAFPERVKERLTLVLTHGSQIDEHERERILEVTKSYYPEIGANNIFLVDSLTELYLREFYGKTMDEVRSIRKENSQIRRLTADCFEMAEGDINEFLDQLEAQASFDVIRKRIERDAQNSASIQMKDFANALKEEYEVLDNNISVRIESLRKKYQNPQNPF